MYPIRKPNRLHNFDYTQTGAYFVTICTKDKDKSFGSINDGAMVLNHIGIIAESELMKIPSHFEDVEICNHIVMPNHVHFIAVITTASASSGAHAITTAGASSRAPTIGKIVRGYKAGVSRLVGFSPWQRNYHDHVIRNQEDYIRIAEYIVNNPARWVEDRYYE